MSLRGIDAQIMVQRTAEYSKDAVGLSRRNELGQDYLAVQNKEESRLQQNKISQLDETANVALNNEKYGSGEQPQPDGEEPHGKNREPSDEEDGKKPEAVIGTKIDIRV